MEEIEDFEFTFNDLAAKVLLIEAMLQKSLDMQAQIIANLENRDIKEVATKVWNDIDLIAKGNIQLMKEVKK